MQTLDFIVEPRVSPAHALATDRHFLTAVHRPSYTRAGALRIYSMPDDVLSLGRFHVVPDDAAPPAAVTVTRRHTGGRALPCGDGFVCVSLVLPHRSALLSADPLALAPYQVLNRYVRGILEGCKLVQVPAFYPGRDFVTVNGRIVAMVSMEIDCNGALLFESVIANTRPFSLLPAYLDAVDGGGAIKAEMLNPQQATTLAQELGTRLTVPEVAELLHRGFAKQFPVIFEPHALSALEAQAIDALAAREFAPDVWLRQRGPRPELDRYALEWVQLGAFEVRFALEQERFLKEVQFSGDFIANSEGVARLEHELRLCPAEWRAIDAAASAIFSAPENFILGVGRVRAIADLIMRGIPN